MWKILTFILVFKNVYKYRRMILCSSLSQWFILWLQTRDRRRRYNHQHKPKKEKTILNYCKKTSMTLWNPHNVCPSPLIGPVYYNYEHIIKTRHNVITSLYCYNIVRTRQTRISLQCRVVNNDNITGIGIGVEGEGTGGGEIRVGWYIIGVD